MNCENCNIKLTDENRADSTGFLGFCKDCEKKFLEEEQILKIIKEMIELVISEMSIYQTGTLEYRGQLKKEWLGIARTKIGKIKVGK